MPYLLPKDPGCNSADAVNEAGLNPDLVLRAYLYSEEYVSVRFHYQLQLIRSTERLSALRYCLFVMHMIRLSYLHCIVEIEPLMQDVSDEKRREKEDIPYIPPAPPPPDQVCASSNA